jgi:hypothetical protein
MTDIADRIRALAPPADDPDWVDVVGRAARRPRRRVWALAAAAVLAVAAVLGATAVTGGRGPDLTERALAAVSGGPVLHVVMSIDTQDRTVFAGRPASWTVLDLSSGAERPVRTTDEIWADAARRRTHFAESIDGLPVYDSLDSRRSRAYAPPDPALTAFFNGYKDALASGKAVPARRQVVEGKEIQWLLFKHPPEPRQPPNGSEIGLDAATGEALFFRNWCPTCASQPRQPYRVETLEGVPRDAMSLTSSVQHAPRARYGDGGGHTIPARDVNRLLGQTALWAGRSVAGVPFSLVQYRWASRNTGLPATRANSVARGNGVSFIYGVHVLADRRHYRPIPGRQSFVVTVTPDAPTGPGNFFGYGLVQPQTVAGGPVPHYDEVALSSTPGWWDVQFEKDGLYVEISGPTRALVLAAARSIQPFRG